MKYWILQLSVLFIALLSCGHGQTSMRGTGDGWYCRDQSGGSLCERDRSACETVGAQCVRAEVAYCIKYEIAVETEYGYECAASMNDCLGSRIALEADRIMLEGCHARY